MVLILVAALTPYLVYKQWLGFYEMIPTLQSRNLVLDRTANVNGSAALDVEVAEMNDYFRRRSSSSLIPGFVAAIAMVGLFVGTHSGIYRLDSPPNNQRWATDVASSWWASQSVSNASWALYFLVGFVGVYYIVRMNLVGARVVSGLWRTRKSVLFGVDISNIDKHYGWKAVTQVLSATYAAILLHGMGLLCLMLLIDIPHWILLLPLLGQFLLVLPFYVILPVMIVIRDVRVFRKMKEDEVKAQLAALTPAPGAALSASDLAIQSALAQRLEAIRKLPLLLPFKKWWTVRKVVTIVIGIGTTIWAFCLLFWNINIFA